MKLRFSLRTMLIVTAVLAGFVFWRTRPATIARQFLYAVESERFADADALCVRPEDRFFEGWRTRGRWTAITVSFEKQSAVDWLLGRRRGSFRANARNFLSEVNQNGNLVATASGVRKYQCRESRADGLISPLYVQSIPDK